MLEELTAREQMLLYAALKKFLTDFDVETENRLIMDIFEARELVGSLAEKLELPDFGREEDVDDDETF